MTDLRDPFSLTTAERFSPLWKKLQAHFEDRLKDLRGKNDGPLEYEQTLTLRGRIEFLREVIRLGQEPPNLDG